ncbi:DUF7344 domain-containing protein [Halosolutus halophilus]|uniref:DUF7344 domain-containing protein n=1 Tax=Halosolutus halophilus TaxID=1552990 RepID=UPI002A5994D0|nr:ArsR family transcriptional regulator [Halosolutus halophilus]
MQSSDETAATSDLLADRYRRAVLRALDESGQPVSLNDLADRVALDERSQDRGPIADWGDALLGTRRRVHISLRHVHVPKLADAEVVDFDPDANTVALREPGADLLTRLDSIDEERTDGNHQPGSVPGVPAP